ncbi:MAG: hypothetical protein ABL993_02580 [Vicinamibacterales bacterium]
MNDTGWDPNEPDPMRAQGWGEKQPSGWGVRIFLAVCAVVVGALVVALR